MATAYPIEAAPTTVERALRHLLAARDRMRALYALFAETPVVALWDAYVASSEEVMLADGQAHRALLELAPAERRKVFPISGRLVWLEWPRNASRPVIVDVSIDGQQTCPNCHGAGRNVYLFTDSAAREATCFTCGGAGSLKKGLPS